MRRWSAILPFLLFPATALAQVAPASSLPSWMLSALAGLGVVSGSALVLMLFHKFASPFFSWLAAGPLQRGTSLIKTGIATSELGMSHPEAVAIVNHQVDNLSADISVALLKVGADFANLSALTGPALLNVAKDAETTFMAGVDEKQLLAALEALGQAGGGDVLAWVKKTIIGLIHPVPAAPTTSLKTVITTQDGTKVVAPAANPSPGAAPAAAGFVNQSLVLALCLSFIAGALVFVGCTASQGAVVKSDAELYASQVLACAESEVVAAVPAAVSSGAVSITSASVKVDSAALATQTKADAVVVAWCAADDAGRDIEAAFQRQVDGGASIAATDAAELVAKLHSIRVFQSAHPVVLAKK